MVIVLPDEKTGLTELESKLDTLEIGTFLRQSAPVKVEVTLPKFKLEYDQELSGILSKVGYLMPVYLKV